MRILKADFIRTFVIGFALGAVAVFGVTEAGKNSVVPSAIAAPALAE